MGAKVGSERWANFGVRNRFVSCKRSLAHCLEGRELNIDDFETVQRVGNVIPLSFRCSEGGCPVAISNRINQLLARPSVKNFFEGKSVFTILAAILGVITTVVAVVGKSLSADKYLAHWLESSLNNIGKDNVGFKSGFEVVLFLVLMSWAALIWLAVWSFLRRFQESKEQQALNEFMSAVRLIRDQTKNNSGIKAWGSVHFVYLINKDFSGSLTRDNEVKAVDEDLHFIETSSSVEDEADAADSLATVKFRVESQSADPIDNVVYLPSENQQRLKKACIFFLPPVKSGASRKYRTFYEWPGMFRKLKKLSTEDFEFNTHTKLPMTEYIAEVYLEEGAGGTLECEIAGNIFPTQSLSPSSKTLGAWRGKGHIYKVTNIPAGEIHLVLRVSIRN